MAAVRDEAPIPPEASPEAASVEGALGLGDVLGARCDPGEEGLVGDGGRRGGAATTWPAAR